MRRTLFLLVLLIFPLIFKLQGVEIPQETSLYTETLENGVKVWLQESAVPSHMVSLRIVWETDAETKIDVLDCPYEWAEITSFLEYSKEDCPSFAKNIGVIAVGDFDKNQMKALIKEQFSAISSGMDKSVQSTLTIYNLEDSRFSSLTFSYPTPPQSLKTEEDLKTQWGVYFLQKLVQAEFQESLKESGGIWADSAESTYPIPQSACMAKVHAKGEDLMEILEGFLVTVQEIKKRGLLEERFKECKTDVQKMLFSMSRRSPDSNVLASYYADQFAYGQKCPPYSFFVQTSLNLIAEMTLHDVHMLVGQFLKDNNRLVEINLSSTVQMTEEQIKEVLATITADGYELTLEEETQNSTGDKGSNNALVYIQLPLTPEESKIIGEIIEKIGNHGWVWLAANRGDLKAKEKQIKHVHPLRFLGEIFSNTNLKSCMRKVEKDMLKWNNFIDGLKENMEKEFKRNNLFRHIEGFCQAVRADPEKVKVFIQKHDWKGLVKYLNQI